MQVPEYALEFIDFLTDSYNCYWLTTHCRTGENKALQYLSEYYDHSTIAKLARVKPTDWTNKKTEGIDYSRSFIWLDDYPFNAEKQDLIRYGCLDSLVTVDLANHMELKRIEELIRSLTDR